MRTLWGVCAGASLVVAIACGPGDKPRPPAAVLPAPTPAVAALSQTPAPSPSLEPVQGLRVLAAGHGVGRVYGIPILGFAFIVENPNATHAAEILAYQIIAYDAAGRVVATQEGNVSKLETGETRGVAGSVPLAEGQTVARISLAVVPERFVPSMPRPAFATEQVRYQPDPRAPKVVGVVKNPRDIDITQMSVSAVAYDARGRIIGGGFAYLAFLPANGQAVAEVLVSTSEPPARVELYPAVSGLTG